MYSSEAVAWAHMHASSTNASFAEMHRFTIIQRLTKDQPTLLHKSLAPAKLCSRRCSSVRARMKDRETVIREFKEVVNMSAGELGEWLQTPESNSVGWKENSSEAVGHESGRRIVELLGKMGGGDADDAGLTEDDISHMSKVVGYVHRHKAQAHRMTNKTEDQLEHTRWTSSLRNWGHDPLKDQDVLEQVTQTAE